MCVCGWVGVFFTLSLFDCGFVCMCGGVCVCVCVVSVPSSLTDTKINYDVFRGGTKTT